jgi:hypothetical protein
MEKLIVALDFDGTIASGEKAKIKYARQFFNINIRPDQTTKDTFPLGGEKYMELMRYVATHAIMEYELESGVKEVLQRLYCLGFRFVVITSRFDGPGGEEFAACIRFCKHNSLPITYFHNTNGLSKHELCQRLHARAMIDDTCSKLLLLQGTYAQLFFLRQPWNVHELSLAKSSSFINVLRNWKDFYVSMLKLKELHDLIAKKIGIKNKWSNLDQIVNYHRQHASEFQGLPYEMRL